MFMGKKALTMGAAAVALLAGQSAWAEDLTIALSSEPTAMDPHYHNLGPNNQIAYHIFDRLINQGPNQELNPGLATSWEPVEDTVWEFTLREGVTFHDGSPFTADDVAFTIERAPNVPDSPSSFATYTAQITEVEVVDDYTVRIHTADPYPLMPNDLSTIAVISREAGEGASTADYNDGTAAVGTGPFKFVDYVPGDRIVMEPNEDYWGEVPEWDQVTFRPITSGPARVAALLAGDVDVVEGVPTSDISQLEENPDVDLSQGVSNRVIYLHIDSDREVTPMVTAKDGSEIDNPFTDVNARRAISMAIDREAIVEEVMEGVAIPAGQLLPEGFFGVSPDIDVPEYDPEGAQALLAEAGYPDGFALTIHGPNDRYINDAAVVQAIAQMLSRIGIDTTVDTMPRSVYFGRASALEFSLMLVGWGSGTGEASSPLKSLIGTHDPEKGWGASNRGRFSNEEVDSLLEEALRTVDDETREALLIEATEIAMDQVAIIPTHFQVNTWGTRAGLQYQPRTDEYTLAIGVSIGE
ncbi:MAG: ABC transporter substrate-binding protein [Deinococcus-Thermus bacterium]|jgi:peptide/nickel transport system substrate-binding protein|nr:ABC transporter substrate-binding protein [Deinococcota bacterium]